MTGVLMLGQSSSLTRLLGWLGDRTSHRLMFALGVLLAGAGAAVALFAPQLEWFYVVFALAGFANAGLWTTAMAMTVEFGSEEERPYYIGSRQYADRPGDDARAAHRRRAGGLAQLSGRPSASRRSARVITVLLVTAMRDPRKHVALER